MQNLIPALIFASFVAKITGLVEWGWFTTLFLPLGFGLAATVFVVIALLPLTVVTALAAPTK